MGNSIYGVWLALKYVELITLKSTQNGQHLQTTFKCISWLKLSQLWSFSLKCIAMDWTDNMSPLIHVMVCRLFGNECRLSVSQCWPRFMIQFGVTRPQSIKCVNPRSSIISWEILWAFLANLRYHLFCANISRQRNTGQTRSYFVANAEHHWVPGFFQAHCSIVTSCDDKIRVNIKTLPKPMSICHWLGGAVLYYQCESIQLI